MRPFVLFGSFMAFSLSRSFFLNKFCCPVVYYFSRLHSKDNTGRLAGELTDFFHLGCLGFFLTECRNLILLSNLSAHVFLITNGANLFFFFVVL